MSLLAAPGPSAITHLRSLISDRTLSRLGTGAVFRQNFTPPYAALALRIGEFTLRQHPFFASIYAYLTPSNEPESSPSLTIQVELRPYDQEPGNTLGVAVVHIDIDNGDVRGDLVSPDAILAVLRCENWEEVAAFVQYWILFAAEMKWYEFEDHIVPVTDELVENLRRLCGREAFCENVRNAVDGNLTEHVEVNANGGFAALKVDGDTTPDGEIKEDGDRMSDDEVKVDGDDGVNDDNKFMD